MTAVAPPAGREPPAHETSARVPWRGLVWVTWRQHRAGLTGMLLVFLLAAALLVGTGLPLNTAAVWPRTPPWGQSLILAFNASVLLNQAIPVLAGLFLGAPLLARETENGTARLAWTQGVGRIRWLLAQVVPVAVLLALTAAVLVVNSAGR